MDFSWEKGPWLLAADVSQRGVGLGVSFWRGAGTLILTVELPFVLLSVTYYRSVE